MNNQVPIVSIDIESTGLNTVTDRIVSLGIVKIHPDGRRVPSHKVFNPGFKMSDEVIAIHGISNEQAEAGEPFGVFAPVVAATIQGCDLIGYNLMNFDIPMLDQEFRRVGIVFDFTAHRIIDVGNIFKKKEARTLEAAVLFYTGAPMEGAHNSLVDATATVAVLDCQLQRYPDLMAMNRSELAAFSKMDDRIDLAGKIVRDKDGDAAYSFGAKTKGVKVKNDPGFAYWMLGKDFPDQTKDILRKILSEIDGGEK